MSELPDESKYIASGPIYRFVNLEGAKKTLENQTLKFTNPEEFNDPFDCNRAILKFTKSQKFIEQYGRALENVSLPYTKKKRLLYALKNDDQEFLRLCNHIINERIANSVVCCYSKKYDNTLMWSHYADKHQGVCFECNASLGFEDIFVKSEIGLIGNVDYCRDDKVSFDNTSSEAEKREAIINLYLRKSVDWEYEEEVRLVLLSKNEIHRFKKQFLTGVILGCNIDSKKKQEILDIINIMGYDITIKKAIKGDFKLNYETIR